MAVTKQLRISGHVQGVGFRHCLAREARAHGLAGWVRNRRDGSVEALLQGDAAAVDKLITWARRGPPAARVDCVEVQAEPGETRYSGFEQKPTE
ncbi:MAG TPA: acylphosphatase [Burkholderiales bacterium]|jgi:acylphosphatase|nr:acylphosphatase [Burkholderiales bacterium]